MKSRIATFAIALATAAPILVGVPTATAAGCNTADAIIFPVVSEGRPVLSNAAKKACLDTMAAFAKENGYTVTIEGSKRVTRNSGYTMWRLGKYLTGKNVESREWIYNGQYSAVKPGTVAVYVEIPAGL